MFVSYKKISNRREDCFPNGSGNMLIKSNWTRNEEAKRGKAHRCQRSLWSKKDRAYHTWTRRGRRLGIVALTHMTMYRVSRHAAFPCFAPFALFQNDVRVSFMCHSCGATSFSNSIPRYLQSRIYIYIYTVDRCFRDNKARFPICLFRTIRRNEHSCSLSCSWFTISLQPVLRKRYLEPFVRSFGRKSDRELDNDKFVIVS